MLRHTQHDETFSDAEKPVIAREDEIMNIKFNDQLVLVTGAAQGIGQATAISFKAAGARVHLLDIDAAGAAAAADAISTGYSVVDLGDQAAVAACISKIEAEKGPVDILASAAGGVRGQVGQPISEVSEKDWRDVFAANVDAAFWLAQAIGPGMAERGKGRIVFVASGAGLRPSRTGIQAYTAAKHALIGLTKQLSWEFGSSGITVNAVAPGFILSNPASQRQWDSYDTEVQKRLVEGLHTKRLGSAEDIAAAILFLASDAAGWISGQTLSVDGGRS